MRALLMFWVLAGCGGAVSLPGDTASPSADPSADTVPTVVSSTPCAACGGDCLLEELSYDLRYHTTEPIEYRDAPPAGGPHNPCWTTFGVHDVPVDDERWVHNLEHGGVAFLHDCAGCDVGALEADASSRPFGLAIPVEGMPTPFAAVAWGFRMTTSCYDAAEFSSFYEAHVDRAPESIAAGPAETCM